MREGERFSSQGRQQQAQYALICERDLLIGERTYSSSECPCIHVLCGVPLLRLLRPGGSHHRGGTSIGDPASRVPVVLSSTDPGTIHQAVEAIIYKNILEYR